MDKTKMLNYLNGPDEEFCRYLWLSNPDPVTARLLSMVDELVAWKALGKVIGDDPDQVLDRIRNQEHEVEQMEETVGELQLQIEKLESRTVIDMLNNMEQEIMDKAAENRRLYKLIEEANKNVDKAKDREKEALSKLDMWAIMNR